MHLDARSVDLWQVDLSEDGHREKTCWAVLSKDEKQRASRFRTGQLKRRFVLCRGQLRLLLGDYLSVSPASIEFDLGKYGKPHLAGCIPNRGLVFSLSHSSDTGIFAMSFDRAVGVDVEVWRKINHLKRLVNRCFASSEQSYFLSLGQPERIRTFYRIWTAKESFVKAVGKGISLGLDRCAFRITDTLHFSMIPEEFGDPVEWRLNEINMEGRISAALTINHPDCRINNRKTFI